MTKSAQILRNFLARLKAMPQAELESLIGRAVDKMRREITEDATPGANRAGEDNG
jgi:hypothetical protein